MLPRARLDLRRNCSLRSVQWVNQRLLTCTHEGRASPPLGTAPLRLTLTTEEDFGAFAAAFARGLRPGDVVALAGPLGSGKTAFVRAVVRTLHGADQSCSPSFTFRHHYDGDPPIEHIDFFRIDDPRELNELGLEEAFDGRSIALVEWWRNAPDAIPSQRYEIEIEGAGNEPRILYLRPPR
jgi:tRNA threonylcarbamoyladenosine biosynthesis protein TsaE